MFHVEQEITMTSIFFYLSEIRSEYKRGKNNFIKRYPIMVKSTNDLFSAGEISITQRNALLKKLNYYRGLI